MLTIIHEADPDEATRRTFEEGLEGFNTSKAGPENAEDFWIIARDDEGKVHGGVKGWSSFSWLFVDWLWVSAEGRKGGTGSRLLKEAEEIGRLRGCVGVYLETFTFQAPDFYRKQGYIEFGRLEGMPPGYDCIWLKKALIQT